MARKNLTRRRPGKDAGADTSLGKALGKAAAKAGRRSVIDEERNVVERGGPVQSIRRKTPGIREAIPAPADAPKVEVNLDGLEALARMNSDDLAALYDAEPLRKRHREGDRITGTLVRRADSEWLVDVGAKTEATLDAAELPRASPGDTVEAWVVYTDGEQLQLSTRLQGHIAASFLEEAAEAGIPVQGTVRGRSSGGYTVQVGDQTAFVPVSHIDRLRAADPDQYVGQTLDFLVLETGERTVLSRRRLQETRLAERTERLWETLQPDEKVEGTITRALDFGVFVDVDGVEGLLPRSEITADRDADLGDHFIAGQNLRLRVLRVDRDARRISFTFDGNRPRVGKSRTESGPRSAGDGGFGTLGDLLGGWSER